MWLFLRVSLLFSILALGAFSSSSSTSSSSGFSYASSSSPSAAVSSSYDSRLSAVSKARDAQTKGRFVALNTTGNGTGSPAPAVAPSVTAVTPEVIPFQHPGAPMQLITLFGAGLESKDTTVKFTPKFSGGDPFPCVLPGDGLGGRNALFNGTGATYKSLASDVEKDWGLEPGSFPVLPVGGIPSDDLTKDDRIVCAVVPNGESHANMSTVVKKPSFPATSGNDFTTLFIENAGPMIQLVEPKEADATSNATVVTVSGIYFRPADVPKFTLFIGDNVSPTKPMTCVNASAPTPGTGGSFVRGESGDLAWVRVVVECKLEEPPFTMAGIPLDVSLRQGTWSGSGSVASLAPRATGGVGGFKFTTVECASPCGSGTFCSPRGECICLPGRAGSVADGCPQTLLERQLSGAAQVNEDGTDTFRVVFTIMEGPTDPVFLTASLSADDEARIVSSAISFGAGGAGTQRSFDIKGVMDAFRDGRQTTLLSFSPTQSADFRFDGLVFQPLSVTTIDSRPQVTKLIPENVPLKGHDAFQNLTIVGVHFDMPGEVSVSVDGVAGTVVEHIRGVDLIGDDGKAKTILPSSRRSGFFMLNDGSLPNSGGGGSGDPFDRVRGVKTIFEGDTIDDRDGGYGSYGGYDGLGYWVGNDWVGRGGAVAGARPGRSDSSNGSDDIERRAGRRDKVAAGVKRGETAATRANGASRATTRQAYPLDVENTLVVKLPPHSEGNAVLEIINKDGVMATFSQAIYYTDICPEDGWWGSGQLCKPCPEGAVCPGGFRMIAKEGYWIAAEDTREDPIKCPPNRCRGGVGNNCFGAYTGERCSQCIEGYYLASDSSCKQCPASGSIVALLVADCICWALLCLAVTTIQTPECVSMVIGFVLALQMIGSVGRMVSGRLPNFLLQVYEIAALFSGDIEFIKPNCTSPAPFHRSFFVQYGYSLVMSSWIAIVPAIMSVVSPRLWLKKGNDLKAKERGLHYKFRTRRAVTIILTVIYLPLSSMAMRGLFCKPSGGGMFLVAEPSYPCFKGMHIGVFILAIIVFFGFTLGYPAALVYFLLRNKALMFSDLLFRQQFDFNYEPFHDKYWYCAGFEHAICVALAMGDSFLSTNAYGQFSVLTIAFLGHVVTLLVIKPHSRNWENWMMASMSFANWCAVIVNFLGKIGAMGETIGKVISISLLAVLGAAVFANFGIAVHALFMVTTPDEIKFPVLMELKQMAEEEGEIGDDALDRFSVAKRRQSAISKLNGLDIEEEPEPEPEPEPEDPGFIVNMLDMIGLGGLWGETSPRGKGKGKGKGPGTSRDRSASAPAKAGAPPPDKV